MELDYAVEIRRLAGVFKKDATWALRAAGAVSAAQQLQVDLVFKEQTDSDRLAYLDALIGLQDSNATSSAPVPAHRSGQQVEGAAAYLGVGSATETEMASVLKGLQAVLPAISLLTQLQVAQFVYSVSKASKSRQDDDFKTQLQTFYGNALDQQCQLRCMLLNVQLPKILVTGYHLFKHCWKPYLGPLLGLSDINDPRNGLLLFKPLEHAFDDSRICFSYVEEAGEPKFKLELLDMSLKGVKLWDYAKTHNIRKEYNEHQIDTYAATVSFGELQGKALVFEDSNRPYKRCLQFQAVQALRRAKEEKWLPADWVPSASLSYNSEDAKERMDAWLTFAVEAPPPPDSDSASDSTPGGGS